MLHNLEPNDVLRSADDGTAPVASSIDSTGRFHVTLSMPPETYHSLVEQAIDSGRRIEDVISKAFVLYRTAAERHREGKAVGIAPTPDVLETEFVGF